MFTLKELKPLLFCFFMIFNLNAYAVNVKGSASVPYSGFSVSESIKNSAIKQALLNAVDRHISQFSSESKSLMYSQNRNKVEQSIDNIVLSHRIIQAEKKKDIKQYFVVVNAEINTTLLERLICSSCTASLTEGEYLTFVFVTREIDSITQYGNEVQATVTSEKTSQTATTSQKNNGTRLTSLGSQQSNMSAAKSQSTLRANDVVYRVSESKDIESAFTQAFTDAGFEVVEAKILEDETYGQLSIDSFKRDYKNGDVSPPTLKSAVVGLKDLEIPFFAMGTLDTHLGSIDPVTGNPSITVTVNAKILNLKKRFPKTVAAVGPVTYTAQGVDQKAAANNALKLASKEASRVLLTMLRARGVN